MSRAAIAVALLAFVPPSLAAGCADTARSIYLEETVEDLAHAPTDDDDRLEAATYQLRDLASEAAVSTGVSLTDCMRLALVNYEYLQARGESILQADTLRAEAITTMLPRVAFSLTHVRNSNPVSFETPASPDGLTPTSRPLIPQDFTEHTLSVTQPLFDPRTVPLYRLALATRRVEELDLDDLRDELLFQVAAAFYEVLGFDRDVQALRSTLAQVDEQLRVLDARLSVGEAQRQEVLLAEARRAEVEVELVQAELDRETARARLGRLTGLPRPQGLVDTLEAEPPPGDLGRLVSAAMERRPDLGVARAAIDQAEEQRNVILAEYLPLVTLDFDYYTRAVSGFNQFIDYRLSANLLLTIFDGGSREVRLVRARSVERERAILADGLAADIRLEVTEALLAYSALDRAQRALAARRVAAVGAQELASLQYTAGEATNLDVLVAVAERQNAERNEIRGEYSRKLAALRIWLATGEITRSPAARGMLERRP